jgi:hypothetical protein
MSLRFWRRKRLFPGVTANLSKSGVSLSLGVRGAHYTVGRRGQRATVGMPGSGLFVTEMISSTPHGRAFGGSRYRGGIARRPVYALAGALGSMPVWVRAAILVPLIIFAAFSIISMFAAAIRLG